MATGDNFPELPQVPVESRRIALGFKDLDSGEVHKKVVFIRLMDDVPLEEVANRFALSAKILGGMTTRQMTEILNASDVRISYTAEE